MPTGSFRKRGRRQAAGEDTWPPIDFDRVRDISVKIYKARLGPRETAAMIQADRGDTKLRARASCYDPLTLAYFEAFGIPIPRLTISLLGTE